MGRIRKALVAALGATLGAIVTALVNGGQPATREGWAALVGGSVGVGVVAGLATWGVRNAGTGQGSEPPPRHGPTHPGAHERLMP